MIADYDEFPLIGSLNCNSQDSLESNFDTEKENGEIDEEVSFSNLRPENYCVCYVDIVNSTTTTSKLSSHTEPAKYYTIS
ncbi:MAG: hypothetical protein WAM14_19155 [Candidatus Nitrosopolaris sp.]